MTTEAPPTRLQELAGQAAAWFYSRRRGTTGDVIVCLSDDAPDWVRELVRDAHGSMFPDDWRYAAIQAALESIRDEPETSYEEWADGYVDVYTGERYAWLSSHLDRQGYIDEAINELGFEPVADIATMIGWGQYVEAAEVYTLVLSALEAQRNV